MNEAIFTASALTKKYGSLLALSKVDMQIRKGDIYGFIGENGAGKTTLIRILAGGTFPSSGSISLFGETDPKKLPALRRRMSGIIENPAVYPDLTAIENLEIVRLQCGIPGKACIQKTLETVGLVDTKNKKAKNFSLGMKQRLGLGMALIGQPEFLVLDEPTNGLDPSGIVAFRDLIKDLNVKHGITFLISSHILGELYQLATCYGFIHAGQLIEQISLQSLDEKCQQHIFLRVDDAPKAVTILEQELNTKRFEVLPGNTIRLYDYLDDSGKVTSTLYGAGIGIAEISIRGDGLEQYYMNLIGGRRI
jgi:ABC-2 type transport system ATP-binding protein